MIIKGVISLEECHCEPECAECFRLISKIRRLEESLKLEQDEANYRSEEAEDYRKKFYEAKGW